MASKKPDLKTWIPETTLINGATPERHLSGKNQKFYIMKNVKYLVAIAAFVTLAFVGFSAFTAPSGNGTVAGSKKVFGVGSINANSPTDLAGLKWFLTREEAVTQAQLWATEDDNRNGSNQPSLVYNIVEGYINEARASESIPPDMRNW